MKDNRRGFIKKGTALAAVTLAGMSSCTTNYEGPLTHGHKYTTDELWANYEYFIRQARSATVQ